MGCSPLKAGLRCALELWLHHGSSSQTGGTGYASSTTALANSLVARRAVIGALPWGICLIAAPAHSTRLSTTTCETLAIERPEPAMKVSNRAPEMKDSSTENWPRYCHRLGALFKNTGMGTFCRANCALTGLVRTPRPQSTTSGARGLNVLLRQAATMLPSQVGKHDTTLPPRRA